MVKIIIRYETMQFLMFFGFLSLLKDTDHLIYIFFFFIKESLTSLQKFPFYHEMFDYNNVLLDLGDCIVYVLILSKHIW